MAAASSEALPASPQLQRLTSVDTLTSESGPTNVLETLRDIVLAGGDAAALFKPAAVAQLAAEPDALDEQRRADVLHSANVACVDVALAGGKGSSLAVLDTIAGVEVPPFFCVSTNAFRKTTQTSHGEVARALSQLQETSDRWVADPTQGNLDAVFAEAGRLRERVVALPPPRDTVDAIVEAYRQLCAARGETDTAVAVRSSATTEDLKEASFAGQHDTFLNQKGVDDVLDSVRRCWASVFTDRAVEYRNRQRIAHTEAVMCVVVQAMVDPEVAGTAFSVELSTSFPAIHIAATYGLGEAVVSGEETSDEWLLHPQSLEVIKRAKGSKSNEYRLAESGSGIVKVPVDATRRTRYCMDDSVAKAVAKSTRSISAAYTTVFGYEHVDTEFAVDRVSGKLLLLQSRPVVAVKSGDLDTVDPTDVREEGDTVVRGSYSLLGAVYGRIKVIKDFDALTRGEVTIEADDILVTAKTSNYWNQYLTNLRGIVTMDGSPTAHPMLIGRERGLAVICGVPDLLERCLPYDGKWATLDGLSKCLYRGERKLRTATMEEFRRQFEVQRVVPYKDDAQVKKFLQQYSGRVVTLSTGATGEEETTWVYNPNNFLSKAWRPLRLQLYPARVALVNAARRQPLKDDPFCPDARVINGKVADRLVPVATSVAAFRGMTLDECEAYDRACAEAAQRYVRACEDFAEHGATVERWREYCAAYPPMYATLWLSFFWRMHVKHAASRYVHERGVSVYIYEAMLSHAQETLHAQEEDTACRHAILDVARLVAPHVVRSARAVSHAGDADAEAAALRDFVSAVMAPQGLLHLTASEPALLPALTSVAKRFRIEKNTDIAQPLAREAVLRRALAEVDIVAAADDVRADGHRGRTHGNVRSGGGDDDVLKAAAIPEVDYYPADRDMHRWLALHLGSRVANSNNHHLKWRGQCLVRDELIRVGEANGMSKRAVLALESPADIEALIANAAHELPPPRPLERAGAPVGVGAGAAPPTGAAGAAAARADSGRAASSWWVALGGAAVGAAAVAVALAVARRK